MNKIVYVNGGVTIMTPFFRYLDAGCRFDSPPIGLEIIEPNDEVDGHPCLIITEEKAPSFFNGYYAKTFFSSKYSFAPFFSKSIQDCYDEFEKNIADVLNFISKNDVSDETRQTLYQLSLVAGVSALDSYISNLILFLATKDKNIFLVVARNFCKNKSSDIISRVALMWRDNLLNSAEQEVIDAVLKTSYGNIQKINDIVLKDLYRVPRIASPELEEILRKRHIIAHRSGRQKDGSKIDLNKSELIEAIDIIKTIGEQVHKRVLASEVVKSLNSQS